MFSFDEGTIWPLAMRYIYLTAKETHIIQYPFNTRNRNKNLSWIIWICLTGLIRSFWAILFVITEFIIFLLILMQKPQKQCYSLEEPCFETDFIACHDNKMYQLRKQHKTFKNQCCRNHTADQKIFIFPCFYIGPENNRNLWNVRKSSTLCLISSKVWSKTIVWTLTCLSYSHFWLIVR